MQREEVQLSQCWTILYGVLLLRGEMRAAVPSISTEEDQLAEDMQEDEKEADDDELFMNR